MKRVLVWVGAAIIVAGAAAAAAWFEGGLFHGSAGPAVEQSSWKPLPHPPGDRPAPMITMIREFGDWHLACVKRRQAPEGPKFGFIQNFGIAKQPSDEGKPGPCHVFIMMRNGSDPRQTVMLGVAYRIGDTAPDIMIMYPTVFKPTVIYDVTGQVIDPTKKQKVKGGFFKGQMLQNNAQYQESRSQDVAVQLARKTLVIPTRMCVRGRCFGRLTDIEPDDLASGSTIVLRLPGKPHEPPRIVDVPTDGLAPALAELGRLAASPS